MTLVGDVAQTGDAAGTTSWARVLEPYVGDRWRLERLTVNYRTGAEIMEVAADVLAAQDPSATAPRSVRESGVAPWRLAVAEDELPRRLGEVVGRELAQLDEGRLTGEEGRLAVIVPRVRREALADLWALPGLSEHFGGPESPGPDTAAGLDATGDPDTGDTDTDGADAGDTDTDGTDIDAVIDPPAVDLEQRAVVLTVRESKGLEFDVVVVVEPERILAESPRGAGDLYVALTRATQRLVVLHTGELPAMLGRLRPAPTAP